jgi:uncharacterized protein (DUF1015 family)
MDSECFEKISTLYLADGHHRSAAAALLSEETRSSRIPLRLFAELSNF